MSFASLDFLGFGVFVLAVFYLLPKSFRKYWLLAVSYYFYGNARPEMLVVLLAVTCWTYLGGWCIHKSVSHKKGLFTLFFFVNIAVLVVYKYLGFLTDSLARVLPMTFQIPELLVPIGLSFFIFQSTTYLGDIYRHGLHPVSFADHALFVSFFPTLLSGPITKARDLLPQFSKFKDGINFTLFRKGMLLFVWGLLQKLIIANGFARVADTVFSDFRTYGGAYLLVAAICYAIQIYADFSSYSDMARGIAFLFGVSIKKNFTNPYLSTSVAEFWRNWHISLNEWFVEYVYIPLGGSRKGNTRKYCNIMAVFLFSGLWHGAQWHFVVWGLLNGFMQVVGQITHKARGKVRMAMGLRDDSVLVCNFRRAIVVLLITATWIFFRIPSTAGAGMTIVKILQTPMVSYFDPAIWNLFGDVRNAVLLFVCLAVFAKLQIERRRKTDLFEVFAKEPYIVRLLIFAFSAVLAILLVCGSLFQIDQTFIYFQF